MVLPYGHDISGCLQCMHRMQMHLSMPLQGRMVMFDHPDTLYELKYVGRELACDQSGTIEANS